MSIIDGNPVNASYTNTRLVSKIALLQDLIGTYNLKNASSGADVLNLQQTINNLIADIASNLALIGINQTNIQANTDSISDLIAEIALGSKNIKKYASDSAYVLDNPPLSGSEIYYNTATGQLRYYDAVDVTWKPVGQEIVGIQENIGLGDSSTTQFTITNAPLSNESILVFLNGRLIEKSEYSIALPIITFNTAPPLGSDVYIWYLSEGSPASPIVATGTPVVIYHTVSNLEITNKELTLPSSPASPTGTMLDFINGSSAHYGVDYNVTTNILSWNGLALDGFIQANDVLRIFYFT